MVRLILLAMSAALLAQACQALPSSNPPHSSTPPMVDPSPPPSDSPPSDPPSAPPATPPPSDPPAPPPPGPGPTPAATEAFADRVVSYQPVAGPGWPTVNPALATGAPGGAQDAVPLGFNPDSAESVGGSIVLGLGSEGTPYCITDGAGADFTIYSSAVPVIDPVDGAGTLNQVLIVAVSDTGVTWHPFPYVLDSSLPLVDPDRYQRGLAGVHATVGTGADAQGGDAFDLADITDLPSGFQACYVRITDAGTLLQDYGSTQPDPWYEGGAVDTIRATSVVARAGLTP